ncbi:hypothetical protein ACWD5R_21205 [Streptomyces sp. NPDC002514]|uniref:hypothetical protein n=1 Tax=unclassified Streptomyces TaxID=2593676 RepID=UPI0036C75891
MSAGPPEPACYWAEVRAAGPVFGTDRCVQYVLGTFRTVSPGPALRWLRSEALRVADRLDPDPARSVWVRPAMRRAAVPVPDCPAELRVWATDPDEQRAAHDRLRGGRPLFLRFPDPDCTFTLSIWPAQSPAPGEPDRSPPVPRTHRVGGPPQPPYVLVQDPRR